MGARLLLVVALTCFVVLLWGRGAIAADDGLPLEIGTMSLDRYSLACPRCTAMQPDPTWSFFSNSLYTAS
jgi:hypothetical protein